MVEVGVKIVISSSMKNCCYVPHHNQRHHKVGLFSTALANPSSYNIIIQLLPIKWQ